jgi:formamidopyrimidine-DNA glycosylase
MPELPEVEMAARNLRRWLAKKTIVAARIPPSRILRGASPPEMEQRLTGARVERIERRGKWLRLTLSTGTLWSHLGMTGKWVRRAPDDEEKYERARLDVRGASVRYRDPRMFGRLVLSDDEMPEWHTLGPDPLVDGIDPRALYERVHRSARSIKEVLLDQTVLAGVGNIQAAEALWRARVNPTRAAKSLSATEVAAIVRGIDASIAYTLADEAGPEITYVEEGGQNPFMVYAKSGQPCRRCKTRLRQIRQGGRATVFCPKCQAKRS